VALVATTAAAEIAAEKEGVHQGTGDAVISIRPMQMKP
jgi:hypothetical protein